MPARCRTLPGHDPARRHGFHRLPVLLRVDAGPESVMRVAEEPAGGDEPREDIVDQVVPGPQEIEDLATHREEAPVDADARVGGRADVVDEAAAPDGDEVQRRRVRDGDETDGGPALGEGGEKARQLEVREPVGIVGEEHGAFDVGSREPQPLADARLGPRGEEVDRPLAVLGGLEPSADGAVGSGLDRAALTMAQKMPDDDVGLVAEAQNEVAMPVPRVIAHEMAEHGLVADPEHRLGDVAGVVAEPEAAAAAEEDNRHGASGEQGMCHQIEAPSIPLARATSAAPPPSRRLRQLSSRPTLRPTPSLAVAGSGTRRPPVHWN